MKRLNWLAGIFSWYMALLCPAVGWIRASPTAVKSSGTDGNGQTVASANCHVFRIVSRWTSVSQRGVCGPWIGEKKCRLLGQSCKLRGWGSDYDGMLQCSRMRSLGWSDTGHNGSKLSEHSYLGCVLPFMWGHLFEVPADLNLMFWKWNEVIPRKSWWIFLVFFPGTLGCIGLVICKRSGLHRYNRRLN